MKKVYGLKWTGNGRIAKPIYEDKAEAEQVAECLNKPENWFTKFINSLFYTRWVVIEMEIKERTTDEKVQES